MPTVSIVIRALNEAEHLPALFTGLLRQALGLWRGPALADYAFDEFASGDYHPRWLIEGVLVKEQPCAIAGPSKALKTSLAVDMAISMASGTPFLGEYPVPKRVRTAVVSGESGPHTFAISGFGSFRFCPFFLFF
jgi:hypothetical protein